MSFIVRIAKNIWPRLFVNNRAPVDRASYVRDRSSFPICDRNGEVIKNR